MARLRVVRSTREHFAHAARRHARRWAALAAAADEGAATDEEIGEWHEVLLRIERATSTWQTRDAPARRRELFVLAALYVGNVAREKGEDASDTEDAMWAAIEQLEERYPDLAERLTVAKDAEANRERFMALARAYAFGTKGRRTKGVGLLPKFEALLAALKEPKTERKSLEREITTWRERR